MTYVKTNTGLSVIFITLSRSCFENYREKSAENNAPVFVIQEMFLKEFLAAKKQL